MKIVLLIFGLTFCLASLVDTEIALGVDREWSLPEMRAAQNIRNKLSDSVRELVRLYVDDPELTSAQYVAKYINCGELRDVAFFLVNKEEPRLSFSTCGEWTFGFELLRLNHVFLGDYLTNSAIDVVESSGAIPIEMQTRSEVIAFGDYEEVPSGFPVQLTPINTTFWHNAQVTINWKKDQTDGQWKIVQFRQMLFARFRWPSGWAPIECQYAGDGSGHNKTECA